MMKKPGVDVMIAMKPKPSPMKGGPGFPALKQTDGDGAPESSADDEESEESAIAATLTRLEGKMDAIIAGLRDLGANIEDPGGDRSETEEE